MPQTALRQRLLTPLAVAVLALICADGAMAQARSGEQKNDRHKPSAAEQAQAKREQAIIEARRKEFEKKTAATHRQIDASGSSAHGAPIRTREDLIQRERRRLNEQHWQELRKDRRVAQEAQRHKNRETARRKHAAFKAKARAKDEQARRRYEALKHAKDALHRR